MQQEIRFATFNVCNLAPPGARLYENLEPSTPEEYEAKIAWTAHQIDMLGADVIGFQEVFSQAALAEALSRTRRYREALHVGFDPDPGADKLTPSVALVSRLPLAAAPASFADFPPGIAMPPGNRDPGRFTRAPLHAAIEVRPGLVVDVVVVHLKSRRPGLPRQRHRRRSAAVRPGLAALADPARHRGGRPARDLSHSWAASSAGRASCWATSTTSPTPSPPASCWASAPPAATACTTPASCSAARTACATSAFPICTKASTRPSTTSWCLANSTPSCRGRWAKSSTWST